MEMYYDVTFWSDSSDPKIVKETFFKLQKFSQESALGIISYRARPPTAPPQAMAQQYQEGEEE